ncbi:metallo-beta-lactamase superfamily protein [Beggiatoa sp. PS]|nr:metallo-beta-lactamase superfamily protein [Beggiatoa sp. PS]
MPEVYEQDFLTLEGNRIEIIPFSQVDQMESYTTLYIPSIKTIFVADIASQQVHLVLDGKYAPFEGRLNAIEQIQAMNPEQVITGHAVSGLEHDYDPAVLDTAREYTEAFLEILKTESTAEDASAAMQAKYPDYNNPGILNQTIVTNYGANTTSALETNVFVAPDNFVTSTLIEGSEGIILVDAQFSADNAQEVVNMIEDSGKTLNAIWISHAHPDHFVGIGTILEKFPNTPVYSTTEVVDAISQNIPGWQEQFGLSADVTTPEVRDSLELEGESIEILSFAQGDTENTTAVYVPSLNTVIAADLVYCGAHSWQVETNAQSRSEWINSLNQIKDMNPEFVVPGHNFPATLDNDPACVDSTIDYIEKFSEVVETEKTADDAIAAMKAAYPDYQLGNVLEMGMQAQYGSN